MTRSTRARRLIALADECMGALCPPSAMPEVERKDNPAKPISAKWVLPEDPSVSGGTAANGIHDSLSCSAN